jgi:AraC-like DNA-binding protein
MAKATRIQTRHEKLSLPAGHVGALWRARLGGRRLAMHRHDELEFNLVLRGQARYLFRQRRQELRPHSLIWLFPQQDHVLLDHTPDFDMWVAVFKPTMLARVCRTRATAELRQGDPPGHFCRELLPGQTRRLHALFQEVRELQGDALNAGLAYALLLAWSSFSSAGALDPGPQVHPAIQRAVRIIREEHEPGSLAALAQQVGVSTWRLSRLFRQQTGVSLVAYRQRQRLQRFLDLYGDGSTCKMLDAALRAGFGSYPQFHRVFRQYMGLSPAEHRRKMKLAGAQT